MYEFNFKFQVKVEVKRKIEKMCEHIDEKKYNNIQTALPIRGVVDYT